MNKSINLSLSLSLSFSISLSLSIYIYIYVYTQVYSGSSCIFWQRSVRSGSSRAEPWGNNKAERHVLLLVYISTVISIQSDQYTISVQSDLYTHVLLLVFTCFNIIIIIIIIIIMISMIITVVDLGAGVDSRRFPDHVFVTHYMYVLYIYIYIYT